MNRISPFNTKSRRLTSQVYLQRDVCFSAFAVFDQDGDGKITLDELKQPPGSGAFAMAGMLGELLQGIPSGYLT